MMKGSKKAFADIKKVIGLLVQDEVRAFSKTLSSLRQDLTLESIEKFSWTTFLNEIDSGLPLLSTVLRSAVTTKRTKDKISRFLHSFNRPHNAQCT
ncbi:hypothetical protein DPMN_160872 [Dreissena polymorpha]|uniref:Uncharacterized protein n=1 Tax=Dreissena polymorpha TaxID=45954 RepID=A0A9D4ENN8_DREPO|nr:hypothetical protein DPMN_160872 [Dreissena polymorpha]